MPRTDHTKICALAAQIVDEVLTIGDEQHPDTDWTKPAMLDNLSHVLTHAGLWLRGDKSEPHLKHMLCRTIMMLYRELGIKE